MNALRILIVEDEALVARDLQTTLVKLGYAVPKICGNGADVLLAVRQIRPHLALMDIGLADGSDGVELARRLQEEYDVPVVFLTAHADARTIQRARDTQPFGYLLKPFHESELRSVVELAVARHQAQQQLVKHHSTLQNTLQSIPEAVLSTGLLGEITFMNARAEKLTGWLLSEAAGRPLAEIFQISLPEDAPADAPAETFPLSGALARATILTKRDGTTIAIEDSTTPIREPDGTLSGIVVLFRPRSGGSLAVSARSESDQNLAGMMQSLSDPLMACDATWTITYLNTPAAELLSGPGGKLIGQSLWDCLPPSIHQRYYHEFSQALTKVQSRNFELELESHQRWFEVQLNPFGSGLLAVGRDITARKLAEESERKMEKLESLGLLARGFAHDFNNLLTVLLGNISLAEMQTSADAPGYAQILTAKQATLQAQGLVQHLTIFARGGVPVKQVTDFGRFVKEWGQAWPHQEGVSYQIEVSASLHQAEVDRQQLARLLHNLMRNAEQSLKKPGGSVTLRLRAASELPLEQVPAGLPQDANRDQWLLLEVSDTGCGISPEARTMVFEPYFTTRDEDHATGLGLTVCESIAKAHGAILSLSSVPLVGTTMSVWLPAFQPPVLDIRADRLDVEISQPRSAPGPRRVLILEDEPLIRQLMSATLKSIGCEVDQTMDGADTIARYTDAMEKGDPYQLLIMDLSIPNGMGGLQALDQILQKYPEARAIVSSGYCDDPVLSRYMDYGFRAVLPKPYQPQELQQMVETMLLE